MLLQDGTQPALDAAQLLVRQRQEIGSPHLAIYSREEFAGQALIQPLDSAEKRILLDQAIVLVEQFYAHLPFKRARYGVDPVQRLRLLKANVRDCKDDAEFHGSLLNVLTSLRDAHTYYRLPAPYRDAFAILPFRLQCAEGVSQPEGNKQAGRRFLVTSIMDGFKHDTFREGAEIRYWNGVEIGLAVDRLSEFDGGANPAARFLRGLKIMTFRSLSFSLPPLESWVVLQYTSPGGQEELGILLPWTIVSNCVWRAPERGKPCSVSEQMSESRYMQRILWDRAAWMPEVKSAAAYKRAARTRKPVAPPIDPEVESKFPRLLQFQHTGGVARPGLPDPARLADPANTDRRFGYLRLVSFEIDTSDDGAIDDYVEEVERLVRKLQVVAPNGLILDLRSNPGGVIEAAERILQFFTPRQIQPAGFHIVSTQLTRHVAGLIQESSDAQTLTPGQQRWLPWVRDLIASLESGGSITNARPLTNALDANDTGQCYQSSVVLLTDATAYSAADIFAAGFQDHEIGQVIGLDASTGGGGANSLEHQGLRRQLTGIHGVPLEPLPKGARLGIAFRRSSRVGVNAGAMLEDVGVTADIRYFRTAADLLEGNRDLFPFLCEILGAKPDYTLRILSAERAPGGVQLSFAASASLMRIECCINGFSQIALPAGNASVLVPATGLPEGDSLLLKIDGYTQRDGKLHLAARASMRLPQKSAVGESATAGQT